MRSEKEMLSLIEEIALEDENIRAAYLEGSRVNPNVTKDLFQDYDVVYIVETTRPYRENKEWITRFGEILYMNYPEDNVHYPSDVENCYGWQIQCGDGNRLDLHVCTRDYALERLEMYRVLVDKDHIMPAKEDTSGERYWVKNRLRENSSVPVWISGGALITWQRRCGGRRFRMSWNIWIWCSALSWS